jgi:hypothetical protein
MKVFIYWNGKSENADEIKEIPDKLGFPGALQLLLDKYIAQSTFLPTENKNIKYVHVCPKLPNAKNTSGVFLFSFSDEFNSMSVFFQSTVDLNANS